MIKVLVVDDDKLVRKGLISAMPWSDFDMAVVGEAGSGRKALELLETTEVDLLLTDLTMPLMSGMELIRSVRRLYPNLFVVVLTMHQDFDFIQEALRLGAIDYIVKLQLEQERFDEVLGRIHARIVQERSRMERIDEAGRSADVFGADAGYVFVSEDARPDTSWLAGASSPGASEIELNAWIWSPSGDDDAAGDEADRRALAWIEDKRGWSVMKLSGITGKRISDIHHAVRTYMRQLFFYDCERPGILYERSVEQLRDVPEAVWEERLPALKGSWLSFEWVRERAEFERLIGELRSLQAPPQELIRLLAALEEEWRRVYRFAANRHDALPGRIGCWSTAERWLDSLYEAAVKAAGYSQYSEEVVNCILQAVKIVEEELELQIYAVEVAKRVGLSRSYFSQIFKDITGQSFNDYLRSVRMDKARDYLLKTSHSIQWIAERTGYLDEKYFSRVFRDKNGMLPSEFRLTHGNDRRQRGRKVD